MSRVRVGGGGGGGGLGLSGFQRASVRVELLGCVAQRESWLKS